MKYYGKIQDPKDLVTKEYVDNNSSAGTLSGTCSTAASTASKIVVCPDFDTLEAGVSLFVTFTNDNTASNPTMNVNSTGAKAIKNGSSTDIKWKAGTTSLFMYDGTNWQQISSAGGTTFNGEEITAVASDQIKIGDVVYTISGGSPWTGVLSDYVQSAAFSPDGGKLVLGGGFTGKAKLYSVSGNTVTYLQDIYADTGTTVLNDDVNSATFSPDGTKLVLGGYFTGYAKLYSVSDNTVTYLQDIYANAGTTALDKYVQSVTFSPDGNKLVLGGDFTGKAKFYSVSDNTITFVSNIYSDAGTTSLNNFVSLVTFSPDGTKLVLGGYFTSYAKLYSVSGNTVTYLQDIYANAGTTALSSTVNSATFSPDGNKLVLGGDFTGFAKLYSVSGSTVTYVSNIYANAGTTALSSDVYSAIFSPDGTKLVLGGLFAGCAKVYSVNGTTITYVSNIYADTSSTALDGHVNSVAFSPDGNKLVLGGGFTGYAKFYSVSDNTVTYLPYGDYAYKALDGLDSSYDQIGIAQTDADAGSNVTVLAILTNGNDFLPPQEGHAGEFLTTDGTTVSWRKAGEENMKFVQQEGTWPEWTASTLPSSKSWIVCYGDGKFVAITYDSDTAAYSEDGINWTASTLPSDNYWNSVCYGNGKFVAIADDSSDAAYSTDGINWTASTLPSSKHWYSVCYGDGKFVAVANNSSDAAYSTDGINWTASTLPSSKYWYSVCYGDGKFVAITYDSDTAAYSEDGINWTASTLPSDSYWYSVCYGNDKFVAVTYDSSDVAAYSEDGINWTASTLPFYESWASVCYGDGKFVAVASNLSDVAAYSEDGISWTALALPSSKYWYSVCYGDGKFVVVADNSDIAAYSTLSFSKIIQNDIDITDELPYSRISVSISIDGGELVITTA